MLIRLACAVKEKNIVSFLKKNLPESGLLLTWINLRAKIWPVLESTGADLMVISRSLIPRPVGKNLAALKQLPETPLTVILDDRSDAGAHAELVVAGADQVLYAGLPLDGLRDALRQVVINRQQLILPPKTDHRGEGLPKLSDFDSASKAMQLFLKEARQVVSSDTNLLILGETGVGKDHLARAFHNGSRRADRPFTAVNTAAIPEQLIESELFGHEQGAFTGAVRSRRGAFEMAHQGTIFLDEIGDMALSLQSKLLRVLQDFEFTPVGGERPIRVDVRVIAATNKDLYREVEKKRFRADLYYRLGVIALTLPPLRKRRKDIPKLADRFLEIYKKRIGRQISHFSPQAMDALCRYSWPGNIRELKSVIQRAILLSSSDAISLDDLPITLQMGAASRSSDVYLSDARENDWQNKTLAQVKADVLDRIEKSYIEMTLEQTRGKVGQTAEIAGINSRSLYAKMKKFGLDKTDFKTGSNTG